MTQTPLMPMATAVWLVENTTLTFKQIADFCKLHEVEIQGIADGEVAKGIKAYNNLAIIKQFVLPIFGSKKRVVSWFVITLQIPKIINPIENSIFVISIKSKRIGEFTINILKVNVAKNPCEKVA